MEKITPADVVRIKKQTTQIYNHAYYQGATFIVDIIRKTANKITYETSQPEAVARLLIASAEFAIQRMKEEEAKGST